MRSLAFGYFLWGLILLTAQSFFDSQAKITEPSSQSSEHERILGVIFEEHTNDSSEGGWKDSNQVVSRRTSRTSSRPKSTISPCARVRQSRASADDEHITVQSSRADNRQRKIESKHKNSDANGLRPRERKISDGNVNRSDVSFEGDERTVAGGTRTVDVVTYRSSDTGRPSQIRCDVGDQQAAHARWKERHSHDVSPTVFTLP